MPSFNMLDGRNIPQPTMLQLYTELLQKGWNSENFAIQTNPIGQNDQIVAMKAFPNWRSMAFLSKMIHINTETTTAVNSVLRNITITREILTGKKLAPKPLEIDENLGYNSIGYR